jgi:hypothetical protein
MTISAYDALVERCAKLGGCNTRESRAIISEVRRTLEAVTPEMVRECCLEEWPEDWNTGKLQQQSNHAILPICEAEVGVGKWLRILRAAPITRPA